MRHEAQLREEIGERLRAVVIPHVTAHITSGVPFTVLHTLGTRPRIAMALPLTNCRVWAEEEDERIWSPTKVVLRCDVAAAPLRIVVIE